MKTYRYKIADIQREVEKRTSYLGKNRGVEGGAPHLLDTLALTSGEDFLFQEYLKEGATQTYDYLKAFGRGIKDAFTFNNEPTPSVRDVDKFHEAYIQTIDNGKSYDLMIYPESYQPIYYNGEMSVDINFPHQRYSLISGKAWNIVLETNLTYTTYVPNSPIEDKRQTGWRAQDNLTQNDLAEHSMDYFCVEHIPLVDEGFGVPKLKSVESLEVRIKSMEFQGWYCKGELVRYSNPQTGETQLYRLLEGTNDSTTDIDALRKEPISEDYLEDFGCITYRLRTPEWQDENMETSTQNYIREAIVAYIMSRWLETVFPTEAQGYLDKFESNAHQAQLALNTEKKILKRRYNLF